MNAKELAGRKGAEYIQSGTVVGLGTGSTVKHTILAVGSKIRDKELSVTAVPTSVRTEKLAREAGIPLTTLEESERLAVTIDGADEVDGNLNLIKGGGGAHFREKIVAAASDALVIVVDASKIVTGLGREFPVPVEVAPFGWKVARRRLESLGCTSRLRSEQDQPVISDSGNFILDCKFQVIPFPGELEREIEAIPGVLGCGLFVGLATTVIVGHESGKIEVLEK